MGYLFCAQFGSTQSLWEPSFEGYISGSSSIGIGESLVVVIDAKTAFKVGFSRIDSKQISVELSGGEGGDLFSFLPAGSTSTSESASGKGEVALEMTIAVRVVDLADSGALRIEGARMIVADGLKESITLSGFVDPTFIGDGKRVNASEISDLRIVYTSPLQSDSPVLSPADIVRAEPAGETPAESVGAEGAGAAQPVEGETDVDVPVTGPTEAGIELTAEKQSELLLLYVNRLIDLILRSR